MSEYFYIIDILSIVFEAFIINIFFGIFGKDRIKLVYKILYYIFFIIVLSILYKYITLPALKMLLLLVFMFTLSLIYKVKYRVRIYGILILFVLVNVFEMIVGFSLSAIFAMSVDALRGTLLYYTVGVLASKSITLFVVKIIQIKSKNKEINTSNGIICLFSIFPIITIVVGIILIGGFGAEVDMFFAVMGVVGEVLLVVANILVFYLFENYVKRSNEQHELELEKTQYEMQTIYLKEVIDKQTMSAKEMHNLKNQLFAIKYTLEKDINLGRNMIDDICNIVSGKQEIIYTKDISLDALINSKRQIILDNDIKFNCECFISDFGLIDKLDLCALLGNLLDNAIEAVKKVDGKRYIKLKFLQTANYVNILVKNNYDNIFSDLSTTKENKYAHGFGLKTINSIVSKYEGSNEIISKDKEFLISILLKID